MICSTVAALNHGNCSKGSRNSSSSRKSQKPCLEMLVTSTAEVMVPGLLDLLDVFGDDRLRRCDLARRQTGGCRDMNGRGEPELRFTVRVRDMDVDAGLLPGEEKQAEGAISNDCWHHVKTLPEALACSHPGRCWRIPP